MQYWNLSGVKVTKNVRILLHASLQHDVVTYSQRLNASLILLTLKETTRTSSLRRQRFATPGKARPGALKNLDRAVATQDMQEQDALDDPPGGSSNASCSCSVQ